MDFNQFLTGKSTFYVNRMEEINVSELVRYLKSNLITTLIIRCWNNIKTKQLKELSAVKSIETLHISIEHADDECAKCISDIKNLTSLHFIEPYCITHEGAKALSKLTNLTKLRFYELHFRMKNFNDKCIQEFSKLTNLSELYLEGQPIGSEAVKALAMHTNLTELNLSNSYISDDCVKLLSYTNCSHNLKILVLNENDIGNDAAKYLAESTKFPNLVQLHLRYTDISFEGAKALALTCQLKNLEFVNLAESALNDVKDVEALAKLVYSIDKPKFKLGTRNFEFPVHQTFYVFMLNVLTDPTYLNEESVAEFLLSIGKFDPNAIFVKYILEKPDKYPFRINLNLCVGYRYYTFHSFLGHPELELYLFQLGAVPAAITDSVYKRNDETPLQHIAHNSQSTHMSPAVKKTNFFTKHLVKSVKSSKELLEQALQLFVRCSIPRLLEIYQSNNIRLNLLNLSDNEKKDVMLNTLQGPLPSDREFITEIIHKASKFLEEKFCKRENIHSMARLQYDYAIDDAKITIPECIGYIKMYIDSYDIPTSEKVELLVTLVDQNPNLAKEKLGKESLNRPQLYQLLGGMDSGTIEELFASFDIERIWREQKELVLLKQVYVAATAYGEENSACMQGIWSQIIASLDEIDLKLMDQYQSHLELEAETERLMETISDSNMLHFADDLAQKLVDFATSNPDMRKGIEEFALGMISTQDPKEITVEQQKILAKLHYDFSCNVKKFLPNYNRGVPTDQEYDIIIVKILNSKVLQNLVNNPVQ